MTGLTIPEVLSMTESELAPMVEIGEEVHKQNQQHKDLLLDLIDVQLATIAHLINNAHYKPDKFKNFLYLKHETQPTTKPLSDVEAAIDAELQLKASIKAQEIIKAKAGKFIQSTQQQNL